MFRTYCPRALWIYGIPYVANIMQIIASFAADLQGRTPLEALTGETPDIYQYLDFGFYNRVWFKEDSRLGETKPGILLGVSHYIGSIMSCGVFPASKIPVYITNVQLVKNLESQTEQRKKHFEVHEIAIADRFKEVYIEGNFIETLNNKPSI